MYDTATGVPFDNASVIISPKGSNHSDGTIINFEFSIFFALFHKIIFLKIKPYSNYFYF